MHLDVFVHPQQAKQPAQPANAIVLQVERKVGPYPSPGTLEFNRPGQLHAAANAVDEKRAGQQHSQAVPGTAGWRQPGQVETDDGKPLRFHRFVEIPVSPVIASLECPHRGLNPAADLGDLGGTEQRAGDRIGSAGKVSGGGVAIEAENPRDHSAVRHGA
jgi:hypothetical protein